MILDSGERREFTSGAVRDVAEGKGRCDLMPLEVVALLVDGEEIQHINDYVRKGDTGSLLDAIQCFINHTVKNNYTAMLEIAQHYEEGCKKYGDRNWEKGIPLHCYIDSGVRHLLKFYRGDKDENHGRAFVWNMMCAIWTHINKPELIDLPFSTEAKVIMPFACTQEEIDSSIEGEHIVNWGDID